MTLYFIFQLQLISLILEIANEKVFLLFEVVNNLHLEIINIKGESAVRKNHSY